jgi:hypothetical protein
MGRYSRKNRGGWGGSVEFDYEIERYKDKESGELYTETQVEEIGGDIDSKYEGVTINLSIEGSAHYTPGYTSGLPENCYDSDSDSEIESVTGPGKEDWYNKLSSKELEDITDKLIEQVQDNQTDYESCAADDAYDRWKDDRDSGYDY